MSDIFISYDREDLSRVKPLVKALEARKWTVWWDRSLHPGQDWHQSIAAALKAARCVIVLWSRHSVESDWVMEEARFAKQRRVLVPALLDRVDIPLGFGGIQTADLVSWAEGRTTSEFDELINGISYILSKAAAPAAEAPQPEAPVGPRRQLPRRPPRWALNSAGAVALLGLLSGGIYFGTRSDPKVVPPAVRLQVEPTVPSPSRVNPKDGLRYIRIKPGKFRMGCSEGDEDCKKDEKPAHDVEITRAFWMGETEVTQAAYSKVTGQNPSYFKGDLRPVEQVNWHEANKYCQAVGLRLPTEAEWEFAARAGSTAPTYGELDKIAWYSGNSKSTHDVTLKFPNAWGLYDMLGNVWEWVADPYDASYYGKSPAQDPPGPETGAGRVLRGGSWGDDPGNVRASFRIRYGPEDRDDYIGFRCAGELP